MLTADLGDAQDDYNKVQDSDKNQASLGHEVLAGGASFIAMKEWEDHQRKEGKLSPYLVFTFTLAT